MRLKDLKPEWDHDDAYITFQCPKCAVPADAESIYDGCVISIPVATGDKKPSVWQWNGEKDFEKVTISPSIFHHCKSEAHFFIRDGSIIMA